MSKEFSDPTSVDSSTFDSRPTDVAIPSVSPSEAKVDRTKPWAPLTIPAYRSFWIAGLFSNIGTWMHETGAVWLMTDLQPQPEMVAAVRTAMTIPVFCLALPAGVWADRFDRRVWLLSSQCLLLFIAATMATLTLVGWMTPTLLLFFTACMGMAMILNQPAWQALTPELVPPALIPSAVQAGSVSFNLARSLGPAVAGLVIYKLGVGVTFLFNAVSFLGVVAVLLFWRPELQETGRRKKPQFVDELRKGIFIVNNSVSIRSALIRVLVFALSASILWSLLSLVSKQKLLFEELGFGFCLALLGIGAVVAAGFLPKVRERYSSESIMLVSQIIFAAILLLLGLSDSRFVVMPALLVVGACWMICMTTLNATAQVHLPRKFRARGMAAYLMFFALGMALGSFTWGWIAHALSIDIAFFIAAATLVGSAFAVHGLKLGSIHVDP